MKRTYSCTMYRPPLEPSRHDFTAYSETEAKTKVKLWATHEMRISGVGFVVSP